MRPPPFQNGKGASAAVLVFILDEISGTGSGISGEGFLFETGAVLGTITGSLDHHGLGPIKQTIQPSGSQKRIVENIGPLGRGTVGCQQNAALFVALVDDVVQVFGTGRLDGLEPEIVKNEQVRSQISGEAALQAAIGAATVDVLQHFLSGNEKDIEALAGGFLPKRLRDMGFSYPARAADQ